MAPLYQRFLIVLILLLAFAGRIVVYAIPASKSAKEIIKKTSADDAQKSESSEKQNQLEEKVKLADFDLNTISDFNFVNSILSNKDISKGNFCLAYCHLQVPEQPPK